MTMPSWAERRDFAQAALNVMECVHNGSVCPVWIDDHRFWYDRTGQDGLEYRVVDARTGCGSVIVTRAALASALASLLGTTIDPEELVVTDPRFDVEKGIVSFQAYGSAYEYTTADKSLNSVDKHSNVSWVASPDGNSALILRDSNLHLRDLMTSSERALTTDGTTYNAYGDVPASTRGLGPGGERKPEAIWSPDSRWILTIQTDERHVPNLAVVDFAPEAGVRPVVTDNKTCLPGDLRVTEFRMIAIESATGRQVEARYPRITAVRMNSTPVGARLAWWSADSTTAYFVDIERGEQKAHVVAFDVASGATRIVFTEESDGYVEVSVNVYTPALIAPLPASNELIWYSERDGNGHLYLYDLVTGTMRNAVTSGPWRIREILNVDEQRREIFLLAGGIAENETPYIRKPCVVSFDGGEVRVLSSEQGDHFIRRRGEMESMIKKFDGLDPESINGTSPTGDYFVETVSTVANLPRTWLRRRDGSEIALLEEAAGTLPEGWQMPELVRCKAADGATDTYGLLFRPFGFDPAKSYPLIDDIYGGPQTSIVTHGNFASGSLNAAWFVDALHLSAMGAFVLVLDGRGTAERERAFRTASHRAAQTASNLEDHVAAIRQLAETHTQIDLDRVGITGFSGGGYMSAHAALRFGDVFKVSVAGGGNYDQALFWHTWGERYHGAYDSEHYATQAAKTYADGLTGKLMLIHGLRDSGCHPAALFQLVQALVEANKDVDLVILPRAGHDFTGYGLRRRWDYLATHLIGETPPPSASFTRSTDALIARLAANAKAPEPTQKLA